MIERIFTAEELEASLKSFTPDIFSGKVKALAQAYGFGYPFLKFYRQENRAVISAYYGSAVICGTLNEEILYFCLSAGFSEILCPERSEISEGLSAEILNIMEYTGGGESSEQLRKDTPYKEVYDILKDGFDISFDDWYTDTCHNVRHGISEVFTLENRAAAQKVFDIDGASLISLVAVRKQYRGKDYGGRLIRALSAELCKKSRVFVICEDRLMPFYKKNGYIFQKYCTQIKLKQNGVHPTGKEQTI